VVGWISITALRLVSRSVPADSSVVHELKMMYEQCTVSRVPSHHTLTLHKASSYCLSQLQQMRQEMASAMLTINGLVKWIVHFEINF